MMNRKEIKPKFYNIVKNWKRIKPHLSNPDVLKTMNHDLNEYMTGRFRSTFPSPDGRNTIPRDCDGDWRLYKKGRHAEYLDYVCATACHWVVNFNLKLAQLVEPNHKWRIVTSQYHSTVWDGKETLFDMNGLALFEDSIQAWDLSYNGRNRWTGKVLPIGRLMEVGPPAYYKDDP